MDNEIKIFPSEKPNRLGRVEITTSVTPPFPVKSTTGVLQKPDGVSMDEWETDLIECISELGGVFKMEIKVVIPFDVEIEKDEDMFVISCKNPPIATQGVSRIDAIKMMKEALELYFEVE